MTAFKVQKQPMSSTKCREMSFAENFRFTSQKPDMATLDTEAPLVFHRTLTDGCTGDSTSDQSNCLHMSIPSDNCVISKRISCSISGVSNQCNETQSRSGSVISGQGAPRTDHRSLFFSADPPDCFKGSFCILLNCLVHYGNFALCVLAACTGSRLRGILPVERVTALCNPSDHRDGRNTSSSPSNQLSRLASAVPHI